MAGEVPPIATTPPPPPRPLEGQRFNAFEVWKKYEEIAMHFNDLISRLRFQALAGVAGLSASIGLLADRLAGDGRTPASIATWAFGVLAVLWAALFALDFFYYNRLLLGAVKEIEKLEEESGHAAVIGRLTFSSGVSDAFKAPLLSGLTGRSLRGPLIFYGLVFLCLVGLTIMAARQPPSAGTSTNTVKPGTTTTSTGQEGTMGTAGASGATSTTPDRPGESTTPTSSIRTPDIVRRWEELKKTDRLTNVATIVESGARLLEPLFEKAGESASKALELGRTFFEHFASSAGDEAGKRAIEAVFGYFSGSDVPQSQPSDPSKGNRVFSVRTGTVRFDFNSAVLPPSGQSTVQGLLAAVPRRNAFWLLVGSTDRSGSEVRNTRLANDRTNAVADYLAEHDVDRHVIIRKSLPELAAPVPGYDGGKDPENRKTELTLLIVNSN